MTNQSIHVIAGGDLIVACSDEWVANNQYLAMTGANLDVERYEITPEQWVELRAQLAEDNPSLTITDLTAKEANH